MVYLFSVMFTEDKKKQSLFFSPLIFHLLIHICSMIVANIVLSALSSHAAMHCLNFALDAEKLFENQCF